MKLTRMGIGEFSSSMKYIGRDAVRLLGEIHRPFAPMLIEFPKNIGKSRDKPYSTD